MKLLGKGGKFHDVFDYYIPINAAQPPKNTPATMAQRMARITIAGIAATDHLIMRTTMDQKGTFTLVTTTSVGLEDWPGCCRVDGGFCDTVPCVTDTLEGVGGLACTGAEKAFLQLGHFTLCPASSAGASAPSPQCGHSTTMLSALRS